MFAGPDCNPPRHAAYIVSPDLSSRLAGRFCGWLALATTLYGLANVMPAIGGFRIGPFPMVLFRASFFALCALVVVLWTLDANRSRAPRWVAICSGLLGLGILYCSYSFYRVSSALDDAMFLFGNAEMFTALFVAASSLFFCWRIWGAPVALLGVLGIGYMAFGHLLPGPLATTGGDRAELLAQNLWYSLDTGILGGTFAIVITTVFPFIILGALLEGAGAGESMIRIAFSLMRKTAGGPAHAAVLASGLFGTVSGSAVANVVGTGVVTIPMIKRRGFSPNFAGAVEAAASSGGQIMPPIMGAAALVMADFVGVSYLTVVIAVLVPAIAYYASLFAMIAYESRRLGIQVDSSTTDLQQPTRQDYLNLLMVFGPLVLIVILLLAGLSPSGASISALGLLLPLSLINPVIRRRPKALVDALAEGGLTFAQLLMAIAAVSIVISALSATGVPVKFGVMLGNAIGSSLFVALLVVAGGCIILGMGMPTLPAYVTVATIALPAMEQLGLTPLTSHMFVFMIAVASAITPPVAIAAYAAASIAGGRPITTAFVASKIGVMIFVIPFAFAYNPMLLAVHQSGATLEIGTYLLLLAELGLAIMLLATALTGHDRRSLAWPAIIARFGAAVLLLHPEGMPSAAGALLGVGMFASHRVLVAR